MKGGVTYVRIRARARVYYVQSIYLVGGGLIIEANIPVQEVEGQRGEGAYFRRGLIFGRIRYSLYKHISIESLSINFHDLASRIDFVYSKLHAS